MPRHSEPTMVHPIRAKLVALAVLLGTGSPSRAESPSKPDMAPASPCTCNDQCKTKWPYTGICVKQWAGAYCGWGGPGIPCTDGGPPPDIWYKPDKWGATCACDDDCKKYGLSFCGKPEAGPRRCTYYGPGWPCAKKDIWPPPDHAPVDEVRPKGDDVGPWPVGGDDVYWRRDLRATSRHDGGVGAGELAPRTGCSFAPARLPSSAPLVLGWALAFVAASLLRRRRR